MQDSGLIKVEQLIIHELPTSVHPDGRLSDQLSPLTDHVRLFFQERLKTALANTAVPIMFDEDTPSPVPATIKELLRPVKKKPAASSFAKQFVPATQLIARHLISVRTNVHSEGLLGCVSGATGPATFVAIIKLELQDGIRAHLKGDKGKQHFEVEVVDDLMLTKNTRIFKVAYFESLAEIEATVCDNQIQRGKLVADYFLGGFLGCALADRSDLVTKKFFETVRGHFQSVSDPEKRSRYFAAALAELNSNRTTVQVARFANENLERPDRKPFLDALSDAKIPKAFPKNTDRIRKRIRRIRWDFDGDLSVSAPSDAVEKDLIRLELLKDGKTKLELEAELKRVTEAGR